MMSSLANGVLFIALVTTSVIVVIMYSKLKKLDVHRAEYKAIFDRTEEALVSARKAVSDFRVEGQATLTALGARIDEAKDLIGKLEAMKNAVEAESRSRSTATRS